jgi:hypothetical protein
MTPADFVARIAASGLTERTDGRRGAADLPEHWAVFAIFVRRLKKLRVHEYAREKLTSFSESAHELNFEQMTSFRTRTVAVERRI